MSLIKIHGPCKTQTGGGRGGSATVGNDLNEVIQNQTEPNVFAASAHHRDRTRLAGFEQLTGRSCARTERHGACRQKLSSPGLPPPHALVTEPGLTCPGKAEVLFLFHDHHWSCREGGRVARHGGLLHERQAGANEELQCCSCAYAI